MKMKNNQGNGAIWVILIIILLAMISGCASSGSSNSSYHDREVEKLKNELYYQAPNGKWYNK